MRPVRGVEGYAVISRLIDTLEPWAPAIGWVCLGLILGTLLAWALQWVLPWYKYLYC